MKLSKEISFNIFDYLNSKKTIEDFREWCSNSKTLHFELREDTYVKLFELLYSSIEKRELEDLLWNIIFSYSDFGVIGNQNEYIKGTCIKKYSKSTNGKSKRCFNLEIGKEYPIISLVYKNQRNIYEGIYRIIDEKHNVFLVPSEIIEINSSRIPRDWIIYQNNNETVIEPKEFNSKYYKGQFSFWEDYYNDKYEAIIVYVKFLIRHGVPIYNEVYREIACMIQYGYLD